MRKRRLTSSLAIGGSIAAALLFAAAAPRAANALPSYKTVCSNCHSAAPVGAVTATPSTTSLTPSEAYTVAVAVNLGSSGKTGFWITSGDAATPDPSLSGGPGSSPMSASLTAPSAPGTYTYKVYGVRGKPSAGQTGTASFSITVAAAPTPTPTVTPTPDPTPTVTPTPDPTPTVTPTPEPTPTTTPTPEPTPAPGADTTPPVTVAPLAAHAMKGRTAPLKYQVNDAVPNGGSASVTIVIRNRSGRVVDTIRAGRTAVNVPRTHRYRVNLRPGTYGFTVTAIDAAGNASTVNGSNTLVVLRASHGRD